MSEKQIVLVTGCSSGLGKALCENLYKKGYFVVATARDVSRLQDINAHMKLNVDVSEVESIDAAVNEVISKTGCIDILINNAGYSIRAAVEEMKIRETEKMFDVNVFGTIRMMQAVVPFMREKGAGKILNIGSISGRMTGGINGAYCASKYAVEAITEAARYELSRFGIQVSVIEPGAMDTDFFRKLADNSVEHMENKESAYANLYQRDMEYRNKQKRKSVDVGAQSIIRIIEKKSMKWFMH